MRTASGFWGKQWVGALVVGLAVVHCGGSTVKAGAGGDAGGGGGQGPGLESFTDVGPCGANGSCSGSATCYFLIGTCGGTGECFTANSGAECGALEVLCGCDGQQVTSGCGYPNGYASGPTMGSSFCETPTGPNPDVDAGDDGGADAGNPDDAADGGGDSGGSVGLETFTDVGPCGANGACPASATCYFAIGACGGTGECFTTNSGGECGAIELLCGCDGEQVYSGCGYPNGYASGSTTGNGSCGSAPGGGRGVGQ